MKLVVCLRHMHALKMTIHPIDRNLASLFISHKRNTPHKDIQLLLTHSQTRTVVNRLLTGRKMPLSETLKWLFMNRKPCRPPKLKHESLPLQPLFKCYINS